MVFLRHHRIEHERSAAPEQSASRRDAGAFSFRLRGCLGVQVPTSCRKQGKCKECVVEVVEGMNCLSPPDPAEKHLRNNFDFRADAGLFRRGNGALPHDAAGADAD